MPLQAGHCPGKEVIGMGTTKKTFEVGRDARTGQFITVQEAQRRPATTVVETIKKPTSKK